MGFCNFLAALPLVLLGLAEVVRQDRAPRRARAVRLALLACLLFYLHLAATLYFLLASTVATWLIPASAPEPDGVWRKLHARTRKLVWLVPVAVLGLTWLLASTVTHPATAGWVEPMRVRFVSVSESISLMNRSLLDIWQGPYDEWYGIALVVAAVAIAWPRGAPPESAGGGWARRTVGLWVVLAVVLYFAVPKEVGWIAFLNNRFLIFAALLAPALLAPKAGVRGGAPLGLVAAATVFAACVAIYEFRAFDREVGRFDEVLAGAAPGKRLAALIYGRTSTVPHFTPYLHFAAYYRARYGGVAETSFVALPHWPLRYRPGVAPPPAPPLREWHPGDFRNRIEGIYYDYVLERGYGDPFVGEPGPRWRVAATGGEWTLYAKEPTVE
jgi:hypothetical protein